jgi:hypothetical protein
MDNDDIELPKADETDVDSVKELMHQCEKKVEEYSMKYWAQAQYNERMISGDQRLMINANWELVPDESWGGTPFNSRNFLRNLSLTWSSRLLEDRPNVMCYPSEPGADQKKASIANKVLEHVRQGQDWDKICFKLANLVQPHSAVGLKVAWDPLYGPPSPGVPLFDEFDNPVLDEVGNHVHEDVGVPLGDVRWTICSIFDYGTDGAEEIEDSNWVYFTKLVDKWDAQALLESAGITEKVEEIEHQDIWDNKIRGVKVTELWYKPSYRYPNGLYAVLVGDYVVQAMDYPYNHGELPVAVFKCGPRRNSPYGSTHVDDAVFIQRSINETVAALSRQARQVRDIKLLTTSKIASSITAGNQIIATDDPAALGGTRYLEPPDLARALLTSLDDNTKALFTVYGLNELLTGAENIKSGTAAKSIAYLNKLDSMKMSGASRSFSDFILRVMRQTLKLYQQYVQAPRIASIAGDNTTFNSVQFIGADVAGVDVRIEPITGFALMRATQVESAQSAMEQQGPTPELQSQAKTGLSQTAFDKSQRDVVQSQIQSILRGEQSEVDTSVDANIAIDEILTVMSQYHNTGYGAPLKQLLMSYMQAMQGQQQENQEVEQIEQGEV